MNSSLHVDVICENIDENPECFHGPTLLFRRRGNTASEYFACSACRDRKDCSFYLKITEKNDKQSGRAVQLRKEALKAISYKKLSLLRKLLKKLPSERRGFCHNCNVLYDVEENNVHSKCCTAVGLSIRQLKYPTEICRPKQNDKVEAQYLFSPETAAFVVKTVQNMGINKVLCIGTPRLHEIFIHETKIKSLLLDIDPKFMSFYSTKQFLWYNMFNNFIMDERKKEVLAQFLKTDEKVIVLIDPPFGGRVEPLAKTLLKLQAQYPRSPDMASELGVMWFFPYFMERHILESLPDWRMLDYRVNYENHDAFSDVGQRRRKAGSPVRIFTNLPLKQFDLSDVEGYKHCRVCDYWVSQTNSHCFKCKNCTSKNGMSYVHCDLCKICVKPSYSHCADCKRCCLTSHECGAFEPDNKCYHCHLPGHKRAHCPDINASGGKKKKRKIIK